MKKEKRERCKEKVASGGQGLGKCPELRAELLLWCSLWELAQAGNEVM